MDSGIGKYKELILDFSDVTFVDHTVMEHLEDYARQVRLKGKEMHIVNVDSLNPVSDHPLAARDKKERQKRPATSLSSRTIDMLEFAQEHNFKFENQDTNYKAWEFYNLSIRKTIKSVENVVSFNRGDIQFSIADITISSGAQATEDIDRLTVMKLSGVSNVPEFYMQKTGIADFLKTAIGNDDINFDSHPVFSKKFELRSQNEEQVRTFFNTHVLSRLEVFDLAYLSGNGTELLFHQSNKILEKDQILNLIAIGDKTATDLFMTNSKA